MEAFLEILLEIFLQQPQEEILKEIVEGFLKEGWKMF